VRYWQVGGRGIIYRFGCADRFLAVAGNAAIAAQRGASGVVGLEDAVDDFSETFVPVTSGGIRRIQRELGRASRIEGELALIEGGLQRVSQCQAFLQTGIIVTARREQVYGLRIGAQSGQGGAAFVEGVKFFLILRRAGTLGRNDTSATPMSDLFRGGIP